MSERRYNIKIADATRDLVAIDDFRIADSSMTVLFGESGIGKSLSAQAVYGLLDPDDLSAQINGKPYEAYLKSQEVADMRRNGFFVFQEPSSHLNPLLTLREQLNEGSLATAAGQRQILERLWRDSAPSRVEEILDIYPKPYRPSGGEKQRILSTMAFKKMSVAGQASSALFVFDEPTGNLDNKLRDEFLDLLVANFRDRDNTILLITHDYSMISRLTKEYPDIENRILYKELVLDHGKLRLRDFLPKEYLSWIATRSRPSSESGQREPLLRFESGARIFGRSLVISRDPDGKEHGPLVIHKGRMTYLKAPSGTGKTTILKMIMGLLRAERMTMRLRGTIFSESKPRKVWQRSVWGRLMTMVFQHADEALNQNSDVKGVFAGLRSHKPFDNDAIVQALSELFEEKPGVDFLKRPVKFLSGGQKQRLNLLRSMVLETEILLLDEPLNGLDFSSSVKVIARIEEKLRAGKGVLVISHNEEIFDTLVSPGNVYYLTTPG